MLRNGFQFSNLGPAEWLPQRRVEGTRAIQPSWLGTRDYTINTHKCIHRMSFKRCAFQTLKEILKSAMKEMGFLDVHINIKAVWAKGTRNVPYCMCVRLSRKHKRIKTQWMNSICWLSRCLSPLSKIYSQCGWELTADCEIKSDNCKKKGGGPLNIAPCIR